VLYTGLMRAIHAWGGRIALTLTLALGCGKPHEPLIHRIPGCGGEMDVVEVEGHLYGWAHSRGSPVETCVFDIDARGELRVERHVATFETMLVEGDGTQTFAMPMPTELLFVRLFRRDADGLREIDELRSDELSRSSQRPITLLPTARGPALVALTREGGLEPKPGARSRVLQTLDRTAEPVELPLLGLLQLFHDAGTIVAVNVEPKPGMSPHVWQQRGPSFTVSVLDVLVDGEDALHWTSHVTAPDRRNSSVMDVAVDGERVFVLALEEDTEAYWLACMAIDDGELLWTAPIELGEPQMKDTRVGMRAKSEGVVVAVYGLRTNWTVVAVELSATGEQSIVGKREIKVPQVFVVEPAASGRVWLGGPAGSDTWITSVELR
jgi:hypothetical protein